MIRIFTTLASANVLALVASILLGFASQGREGVQHPTDSIYLIHFSLGLFAVLLTLLIHCIIFTYFLGTGRWVKEVKLAYDLPDAPWPKLTRELKRRTFPPALAAMLVAIAAAATGAGVQFQPPLWPWLLHASLAGITLAVNLWAFTIEFRDVRRNTAAIEAVMKEVDRIRAERGLPNNAAALLEEN